jgi:hypothetical protein
MNKNRKRVMSVLMVFVLTVSGLITITPPSGAESEGDDTKMEIEGLTWDTTNQGFVVSISLKFGLATAGEHTDFLVHATLNFDVDGIPVTLSGESNIVKADGAIKDSEGMISIESIIITWDRLIAGQKFVGLVDVDVDGEMDHFASDQSSRMADSHAAYRGTSVSGCTSDDECDDGNKCNGQETCVGDPGECIAGTPLHCDEGLLCRVGFCDPSIDCDYSSPCTPLPPPPTPTD